MDTSLDKARSIINEVDAEMAKLFVRRMQAARLIAEYKSAHGLKIYDPVREEEVIKRNSALIEDEELRGYYISFLRNNMAVSRSYQDMLMQGMRVAYCGTEGAFAHIATEKLFPSARKLGYGDFRSAYEAVENGEADVAVLPLENSYNGEVGQVTDLMFSGKLYITAMTDIAVTQDLIGLQGSTPENIKTVISHPQALAQCAAYIEAHGFETREYSNTALAAKHISEMGDPTVGAIASAEAARVFGLKVLEHNINASRTNTTRFGVFSRTENAFPDGAKGVQTIFMFTVRNEAGALAKALDIIGNYKLNMRSLKSRPMKELLWQYYFYVEAEGNLNTDEGKRMFKELSECCDMLKTVGSFTMN